MRTSILSRMAARAGAAVIPSMRLRRALHQAAIGEGASAFPTLARAARRGHPRAQYRVGQAYLRGAGVPASHAEAAMWLEQAAEAGITEAQHLLATFYANGMTASDAATAGLFSQEASAAEPDHPRALHWAWRAAKAGPPNAKALLAHLLSSGPEATRNTVKADMLFAEAAFAGSAQGALGHGLALLRCPQATANGAHYIGKAAEAGLPFGIYMLGVLHENGTGVKQDPVAAAPLFARAAELGLGVAQTRWGRALLDGYGVTPNPITGETWLRRAALAGDPDAAMAIGTFYARRSDLLPNLTEAASWFSRAAGQGHAAAAHALGMLYLNGAGVVRDHAEAARLFEHAATNGNMEAMFAWGASLGGGHGVPQDRVAAQEWFRQAAERGHGMAALMLGRYLLHGLNGPADPAEGRAWLEQARQRGIAEADAEIVQQDAQRLRVPYLPVAYAATAPTRASRIASAKPLT